MDIKTKVKSKLMSFTFSKANTYFIFSFLVMYYSGTSTYEFHLAASWSRAWLGVDKKLLKFSKLVFCHNKETESASSPDFSLESEETIIISGG